MIFKQKRGARYVRLDGGGLGVWKSRKHTSEEPKNGKDIFSAAKSAIIDDIEAESLCELYQIQ